MLLNTDNLIVIKRAYFVKKMRSKILIMRTFQPGKTSFCQTDNEFSLIIKKFFQGLHGSNTENSMLRIRRFFTTPKGCDDCRKHDAALNIERRRREIKPCALNFLISRQGAKTPRKRIVWLDLFDPPFSPLSLRLSVLAGKI